MPTIEDHLSEAAGMFCEKSKIWRVNLDDDTTIGGEPDYELDAPTGTKLVDILFMQIDEYNLHRVTDRLEEPSTDLQKPDRFAVYSDKYVRFYDTPDSTYTFRAIVVIKPALGSKTIEDFIYGAVSRLLSIPGKEWSDPQGAAYYNQMFLDGIVEARTRDSRKVKRRTLAHFM